MSFESRAESPSNDVSARSRQAHRIGPDTVELKYPEDSEMFSSLLHTWQTQQWDSWCVMGLILGSTLVQPNLDFGIETRTLPPVRRTGSSITRSEHGLKGSRPCAFIISAVPVKHSRAPCPIDCTSDSDSTSSAALPVLQYTVQGDACAALRWYHRNYQGTSSD